MKGLGARLLGGEARFPLEQRIFHVVLLLGAALTVFATVMDATYGFPIWADLAFIACWLLLYGFARFGRGFRVGSIITVVVIAFIFIPYQWTYSNGTSGAIPAYTVLILTIFTMVLSGPLRIATAAGMLAVVLLLVGYDAFVEKVIASVAFWDWAIHLTVIFTTTALLVILYSNAYRKEKRRSESYAKTIEAHVHQQTYYVENLEQLIGKLKSERHDFNNHLGVMYGLLVSGEAEKAKAYASQLVKEAVEYRSIVNVPYPAVRALLNHKLSIAREQGVILKLDIGLPEGLKINEFDLTVILGNLLDNAAEACAAFTDAGPYIDLALRYEPEYLVIHIANPYTPAQKHRARPDPENHGFGLKNVEYFVGKHEGFMEIKKDGGVFRVDIALPVGNAPLID